MTVADTLELGAGQYVMNGRFVSWGITASEGFYRGAGLLFESRPAVCVACLPFGREVKNNLRGAIGVPVGWLGPDGVSLFL